jgi:tetratricopeptide (TPR) repeat protein
MPLTPGFVRRPEVVLAAMLVAFGGWAAADWYFAQPEDAIARATFVGRDSCIRCHQPEAAAWTGSNHDRAMELATDQSVLGDFNDAAFERLGERTRFFRDGRRFMVNAEGPDGEYRDYEIKWTFGIDPLQQYMVELENGRIQVLRVSWDVHKKEWFYVTPPDVTDERIEAGDPLHWTGLAQNWNTMCAECHSTDYHKNFNLATNSYAHKFSEIDVSCEACHGPGSLHVQLAEGRGLFWDRNVHYGLANSLKNVSNVHHVDTCAPCHSRRAIIHADYRPGAALYDSFDPVLLYNGLYFSDGQIEDEVYEHGSFTQSKMYRKGVRCSDCHNPHSLKLKFTGNQLCAQCHLPGKYDGVGHHRHAAAVAGAPETQCVSCHMPTRTYMVVDDRHDHSLRVPRPDLSVKLGTPNACNQCHTKSEEDAAWAAARIVEWYGDKRPDDPHWAHALHAAQRGEPDGEELLRELLDRAEQPELVRATAVSLLAAYPTMASERVRQHALRDDSPAVRAAAVRAYSTESPARLLTQVRPMLDDPVRAVRMAATSRLVAAAPELAQTEFRDILRRAAADYRAGQANSLDRVESHMSLATLAEQLGDIERAIASFRDAIRVEPYRAGPRRELARLLDYLLSAPDQAALRVKLEISTDEIRRLRAQEVDLLARDAKLLPNDATPRYDRGLLLYLLNDLDAARESFQDAVRVDPFHYTAYMALALICEKQERWEEAAEAIKRMAKLQPQAQDWRAVLRRMRDTVVAQQAEEQAAAAPHSESLSPDQREVEPDGEAPPKDEDSP